MLDVWEELEMERSRFRRLWHFQRKVRITRFRGIEMKLLLCGKSGE